MEKSKKRLVRAARNGNGRQIVRTAGKNGAVRPVARASSQGRSLALGAIAASLLVLAIAYCTSGYIPSKQLDAELLGRIRRTIGNDVIVEFKKIENLHGFDNNTVIYFYYSAKPNEHGEPQFTGRHVTFFDKARENILDRLLNREAGYRQTATFSFEVLVGPDSDSMLIPIDAKVGDLDGDGLPELLVRYATEWDDGTGYSGLIFRWDGTTYQVGQLPNLLDWLPKDGPSKWSEELWQRQIAVAGLPFDKVVSYFNGGDFVFEDFEGQGSVKLMSVVPYGGSVMGYHDALVGVFEMAGGAFRPYKHWNNGNFKVLAALPAKLRKNRGRYQDQPLPEKHDLAALVQRGFATPVVESADAKSHYGKLKERRRQEEIDAAIASVAIPEAEAAP